MAVIRPPPYNLFSIAREARVAGSVQTVRRTDDALARTVNCGRTRADLDIPARSQTAPARTAPARRDEAYHENPRTLRGAASAVGGWLPAPAPACYQRCSRSIMRLET